MMMSESDWGAVLSNRAAVIGIERSRTNIDCALSAAFAGALTVYFTDLCSNYSSHPTAALDAHKSIPD